ncbi:hypothetical protein MKW92_042961 [Papaver armeniacum]|nr:hypothetical protein MKW92_042961 [Papaver armeniacum]
MKSYFTFIQMVVALILCSLLLSGFFNLVEATKKIDDVEVAATKVADYSCTTVIDGTCRTNLDCINHCQSKGYSDGYCEPETNMNHRSFICCCLY